MFRHIYFCYHGISKFTLGFEFIVFKKNLYCKVKCLRNYISWVVHVLVLEKEKKECLIRG